MVESNIFETIKLSSFDMDSTFPFSSKLTDKQVVDAIREGKGDAMNKAVAFLYGYKQLFCNYILQILKKEESYFIREETLKDLEEVYHDAVLFFIKKVTSEPPEYTIGERDGIKSYILRTGQYKYFQERRAIAIRNNNKILYADTQPKEEIPPVFKTIKEERANNIQQAIKELDDNCFKLLDKCYNEGVRSKDIAHERSVASNTIDQQILRCREKLKKILITKYRFPENFA